jgi:hypothetical protein
MNDLRSGTPCALVHRVPAFPGSPVEGIDERLRIAGRARMLHADFKPALLPHERRSS